MAWLSFAILQEIYEVLEAVTRAVMLQQQHIAKLVHINSTGFCLVLKPVPPQCCT